jgi:undecaprenyl-diphosphatase
VDGSGRAWVRGFGAAETGASDHLLALDVAHLLVTTAELVGPKEAANAAVEVLGPAPVLDAVPLLQRLALPGRSVRQWRQQGTLLSELRAAIAELTGTESEPPLQLTRIQPRTMLSLAAAGLAVYFLLPQVGHLHQTFAAVSRANWWWLALAFVPMAATYVAAAIGQAGAVNRPIPLGPLTLAQVACSFTNRVTPAGTGGLGLNERFLEKEGVDRAHAIAAVSLNVLAGAVVHFLCTMLAIAVLGSAGIGGVRVPPGWWFLVGALAALLVTGAVLLTPLRRRISGPLVKASHELLRVVRRPAQALRLFGGSAGVTIGNALALAAALACFGAHVPLDRVVVVYLGGSAVASVSPTPGALGAVEAALLAGLTGIGVAPGPALAGVLAFRVVTFWLPTVPGVWAFHELQRRRLV